MKMKTLLKIGKKKRDDEKKRGERKGERGNE